MPTDTDTNACFRGEVQSVLGDPFRKVPLRADLHRRLIPCVDGTLLARTFCMTPMVQGMCCRTCSKWSLLSGMPTPIACSGNNSGHVPACSVVFVADYNEEALATAGVCTTASVDDERFYPMRAEIRSPLPTTISRIVARLETAAKAI